MLLPLLRQGVASKLDASRPPPSTVSRPSSRCAVQQPLQHPAAVCTTDASGADADAGANEQTPLEMLEPIVRGDIEEVSSRSHLDTCHRLHRLLWQALPTTALLAARGFPLALPDCRLRSTTPQIWDSVVKREQYAAVPLSNFFKVEVTALPNFVKKKELFKEQEWRDLGEAAQARAADGFGRQASAMYDAEAAYYDEGVRSSKREGPHYVQLHKETKSTFPERRSCRSDAGNSNSHFLRPTGALLPIPTWGSKRCFIDAKAYLAALPAPTSRRAAQGDLRSALACRRRLTALANVEEELFKEQVAEIRGTVRTSDHARGAGRRPARSRTRVCFSDGAAAGVVPRASRSQTTQGVWLGLAAGIQPPTLVCDIEGTDGRERGEDDTAFEKQSALFALAVSDIVIVNMWCHDIGREQAANKPLLKTVFQVMLRLFTPRKTTLLFVIRDKTKTPMETLEPILREDIQKIWDNIAKPSQYAAVPLSDFFNVEVTALANFEEKEELFKEQVMELRARFFNSIVPGGLAGDRRGVVPASAFSLSAQEMWRIIRENRDLDLPAHKVMVATVRCEEIAREQLLGLRNQQEWRDLDEAAKARAVDGFGRQASAMLEHCIEGYDAEAAYFDEGVRSSKRELLLSEVGKLMQPAYTATVAHHRTAALVAFKEALDRQLATKNDVPFAEAANATMRAAVEGFDAKLDDTHVSLLGWDTAKPREKLLRDLEAHVATLRLQRLAAVTKEAEVILERAILDPAGTLLDAGSSDTWPALRELLSRETQIAERSLVKSVEGYKVEEGEAAQMAAALVAAGRTCIERRAREEAKQALIRMKDRFNMVFSRDAESMPRVWKGDEDIRAITRDARAAVGYLDTALRLLAVVAAVRLNKEQPDTIEPALLSLLSDTPDSTSTDATAAPSSSYLTSSTWETMPEEDVLLSPGQCRILWRQLKAETEYTISQAMAAQEASRRKAMWLPPPWAMVAMFVLGFNEFCAALAFLWDFAFNPIMWFVAAAVILLGRALLKQIDLRAEFRHGLVTGLLSVSAKVVPAMLNVLKRLAEVSEERLHLNGPTHEAPVAASETTSSLGAVLDNPLVAGQGPLDAALRRRPSPVQASMVTT
eukprot:SM000081S22631  [mRNA]  locus=s81:188171:199824:+ [translate_table: standard]